MMSPRLSLLAAAAFSLLTLSEAQDAPNTKPAISPAFDFAGTVESGLRKNLSPTQSTHDGWGAGWILDYCKTEAKNYGFSPFDIEVFNVHYSDCSEPWIMCRHKNARPSQIDMIDIFGRMPLGMREYIRHIIALPHVADGAAALSNGDNIAIGDGYMMVYIFAHEISHSLDSHALLNIAPAPFSTGSIWKDNYNQDSAVASEYARSAWPENFAETGIVGLYDKVVPGGIGTIQPNWNKIFHQYATYQGYLGNIIIPRAKSQCTQRLGNSPVVPMGDSAKFRARDDAPDVSIGGGIRIIPEGVYQNVTFVTPAETN